MADMAAVAAHGYRSVEARSSEDMRPFEAAVAAFLEVKPDRFPAPNVREVVAGLLLFCCVAEPRLLWPL